MWRDRGRGRRVYGVGLGLRSFFYFLGVIGGVEKDSLVLWILRLYMDGGFFFIWIFLGIWVRGGGNN